MIILDGEVYRDFHFGEVSVHGGHERPQKARVIGELFLGETPGTKPALLLETGSDGHGFERWRLSAAAARDLARALMEAANFREGYRDSDYPPKPWPWGVKVESE